ncbi:hypothetical protein SRRS_07710 [Sporomusa rhizae]|uniref:hypothetical protein n=1 Tax=Sporomusa rhizae TaxID=357999 RepID=UPI00352BCF63
MDNRPLWERLFYYLISFILLIFLGWILIYNLQHQQSIDTNNLLILLLMVFITLGFVFDKISLGKILSVDRQVKELEKKQKTINDDNHKFKEDIMKTLLTSITQVNQSTRTSNNIHIASVLPATPEDKNTSEQNEENNTNHELSCNDNLNNQNSCISSITNKGSNNPSHKDYYIPAQLRPYISMEMLDTLKTSNWRGVLTNNIIAMIAIIACARKKGISADSISFDVKIGLNNSDFVSKRIVVFDGFSKVLYADLFFEVRVCRIPYKINLDRIEVMLNQIRTYATTNSVQAKLIFINAIYDDDRSDNETIFLRRTLNHHLEPAIKQGLLEIDTFEATQSNILDVFRLNCEAAATNLK